MGKLKLNELETEVSKLKRSVEEVGNKVLSEARKERPTAVNTRSFANEAETCGHSGNIGSKSDVDDARADNFGWGDGIYVYPRGGYGRQRFLIYYRKELSARVIALVKEMNWSEVRSRYRPKSSLFRDKPSDGRFQTKW